MIDRHFSKNRSSAVFNFTEGQSSGGAEAPAGVGGMKYSGRLRNNAICAMISLMKYLILLHKSKYGYAVRVPALPGCHTQGQTRKEALENIRDAIRMYLDMDREELKNTELREVEVALA